MSDGPLVATWAEARAARAGGDVDRLADVLGEIDGILTSGELAIEREIWEAVRPRRATLAARGE
jgi:hypothetical protein